MSTISSAVLGIAIALLALVFLVVAVCWQLYQENLRLQQSRDDTLNELLALGEELQLVRAEARTDDLTGLANRRELLEKLSRALVDEPALSVAVLDLDNFKAVNDTYGHATGNDVLVEVGARLKRLSTTVLLAARLSGDEFVLVIRGTPDDALYVANRAWQTITAPICVHSHWVTVGVSIGLITDATGIPEEALLEHADHAMYQAKENGSGVLVHTLRPDTT